MGTQEQFVMIRDANISQLLDDVSTCNSETLPVVPSLVAKQPSSPYIHKLFEINNIHQHKTCCIHALPSLINIGYL